MTEFLTAIALENELHVNQDAPAISGLALETMVIDFHATQATIERMSRMIPKNITSHLVYSDIVTEETLASHVSADICFKLC